MRSKEIGLNQEFENLLCKKELSMPGYARKHIKAERWKVFARLFLLKNNN